MPRNAFLLVPVVVCAFALPAAADDSATFLGRSLDQWSEQFTSADGPPKVHAAWAIAQLAGSQGGSPQDAIWFSELVKLISDRDASVRYWGVMGLAKYAAAVEAKDGGRTAVRSTLHPLLKDDAPSVRIAAAETLGRFGDPKRALPVLIAALGDPRDAVRIQAVTALENLGEAGHPAEATLLELTTDENEYVKRISSRAIDAFRRYRMLR